MALTAVTVFDIIGATQTITFNNPSQVDQITFSSNSITFQTSSTYSLQKSDFLLYFQYLDVFNNLLFSNFPTIAKSVNIAWPDSTYSITESGTPNRIIYDQTSIGTDFLNINYLPIATEATFATRSSPVTITLQEFFMTVYMLRQFTIQVGLN
jgi:hypothetical protein